MGFHADTLANSARPEAPPASPSAPAAPESLLQRFRKGPMKDVREIVFCSRKINEADGHWYANFGYYAHDPGRKAWREGTRLCRLELDTGKVTTLLEDPRGGVRDPQVHYDGRRILFSYRKGGTENYLLYEIDADGSGLRQLTSGDYDDIEPTYLPNDDILFVSSRGKRWVNCWLTQVAVLHRCGPDGENVHPISSNNEHDNTPWALPDGRVIYTRWEYIDRSQVHYHHLWATNPDGTGQMVFFGNLHPGTTMIDAKPVPGSDKIVASFSPGHGKLEHAGPITLVDVSGGPDDGGSARQINPEQGYRDPWAFSEDCFMAAIGPALHVLNDRNEVQEIFRLPEEELKAGGWLHEPRPLAPRPREPVVADTSDAGQATGRLVLANVNDGRNLEGIAPGEIKKLLVLESLPMPIHYTGGMDPISYGGTFTLQRILGAVPVEPDGSAYMELPARRSLFFVALDENDLSVKRMQSFLTVQPGETTSCVGCHEQRTRTPQYRSALDGLMATRRLPSQIEPIADAPEVFDFPRDIQPVLDALCVDCHGYEKTAKGGPRDGRLILSGDRGPMFSHSYFMLTIARLFSDGRNQPLSNYAPRALGSSNSRILQMLDGSHHGVTATGHQKKMLRLWIESGAAYPGTYAALGCGMIGGYIQNKQVDLDAEWPATIAAGEVLQSRCVQCHGNESRLLPMNLSDERGVSFWKPDLSDPRLLTSRHIVFNLTRPENSILLLAPLAKAAGGWGLCKNPETGASATVFADREDPGYQALLAMCADGRDHLESEARFDMPDFRPRQDWVREMKRYGVMPADTEPGAKLDVYAIEDRYWKSLWHRPRRQ